jgi:hypothetical protein
VGEGENGGANGPEVESKGESLDGGSSGEEDGGFGGTEDAGGAAEEEADGACRRIGLVSLRVLIL